MIRPPLVTLVCMDFAHSIIPMSDHLVTGILFEVGSSTWLNNKGYDGLNHHRLTKAK